MIYCILIQAWNLKVANEYCKASLANIFKILVRDNLGWLVYRQIWLDGYTPKNKTHVN